MGLLGEPIFHIKGRFKVKVIKQSVSHPTNISMKVFVCLSALLAVAHCGPLNAYLTSGAAAGHVHPGFGDLVATKRGLRPISLEGFSEDDNQDGFVDPIAHAAPVVETLPAVTTTYTHTLPYAYGHPYLHHPLGWGLPVVAAPAAEKAEEGVVQA